MASGENVLTGKVVAGLQELLPKLQHGHILPALTWPPLTKGETS